MEKTKYIITLGYDEDGKKVDTEVEEVEGIPYGIFALRKDYEGWIIDHLPSGYRCLVFRLKKRATKIIKELVKITSEENIEKCIKEIKAYKKGKWLKNAVATRLK